MIDSPDETQTEQTQPAWRSLRKWIIVIGIFVLLLIVASAVGGYLILKRFDSAVLQAEERGKQAFVDQQKALVEAAQPPERIDIQLPENLPFLGNPDAKVVVVEYADFQCPFCKRFQDTVWPELKQKYVDTGIVKFVYYDYAFLGLESKQASQAAYCAYDQGKFWEYHDLLYKEQEGENEGTFSNSKLLAIADSLQLDHVVFATCFNNTEHLGTIESQTSVAKKSGISGTPAITINGKLFVGVQEFLTYEQAINDANK